MPITQPRGGQLLNESVDFAADVAVPVTAASSDITLTYAHSVVVCDTTGATFTLTLPTAVPPSATQINGPYIVKNVGTNALNINTTSSETIDGYAAPLILLFQNSSVSLVSDGTNWKIV